MGHDVAAHGYIHTNMKNKSRREQIDIIRKCSHVFARFQMPVSGFRCPYLSYNNDTLDVLQRGGFAWTSNNMILWPNGLSGGNGRESKTLKKINNLYHIDFADTRPALPRFRDGCLDIPITGPDDEMLVERFKVKQKSKIAETWMNVLRKTHESGEMFHLLFHPERFPHIRESMKEIVAGLKAVRPACLGSLFDGDNPVVEAAADAHLRAREDKRRGFEDMGKGAGEGHDAREAAGRLRPARQGGLLRELRGCRSACQAQRQSGVYRSRAAQGHHRPVRALPR